ncbi:unnamed protein product [Adineta steineri]|uniref:G-protein coupled receptors family 1 profile domain-containing protein n=1 Tax=Adineta steineri TaxID=433720 RepID=A0A814V823_9BILA|nr:unnamed protein product [Adineta steineri]CAF1183795.1 unnamed protein product [Adineta steineri]
MSINQLCRVLYPTRLLFKTKKWILICCGIQWFLAIIAPIPLITRSAETCEGFITRFIADIYILIIVIIFPCTIMIVVHLIIFLHTWSSGRRVAPAGNMLARQTTSQPVFNDREKSLLKHIIAMMLVYVIGWIPLYICRIIYGILFQLTLTFKILTALPIISAWINIMNMFMYHHEFRQYVKQHVSRIIKGPPAQVTTIATTTTRT